MLLIAYYIIKDICAVGNERKMFNLLVFIVLNSISYFSLIQNTAEKSYASL
jgi:hypothetical protein